MPRWVKSRQTPCRRGARRRPSSSATPRRSRSRCARGPSSRSPGPASTPAGRHRTARTRTPRPRRTGSSATAAGTAALRRGGRRAPAPARRSSTSSRAVVLHGGLEAEVDLAGRERHPPAPVGEAVEVGRQVDRGIDREVGSRDPRLLVDVRFDEHDGMGVRRDVEDEVATDRDVHPSPRVAHPDTDGRQSCDVRVNWRRGRRPPPPPPPPHYRAAVPQPGLTERRWPIGSPPAR